MTAKTKKIIGGVFAALVVLVVILGVTGPKHMHAETSIVVNRPLPFTYAYLQQLKNADEWSPWRKMDPNMKEDFHGQDGAVGNSVTWSGNGKVGAGTQTITALDPNKRIEFKLEFEKPMKGIATGYFATEAGSTQDTTKVTWGMDADNTTFLQRFVARVLNCKAMTEKIFAGGLEDLKATLEKK